MTTPNSSDSPNPSSQMEARSLRQSRTSLLGPRLAEILRRFQLPERRPRASSADSLVEAESDLRKAEAVLLNLTRRKEKILMERKRRNQENSLLPRSQSDC